MKYSSDNFNSLEDYLTFFKNHPEIKTRTQFKKEYGNLYDKWIRLKFSGNYSNWELPIKSKRDNYNLNLEYSTLDDFQNYINVNKIKSSKEFIQFNKPLHDRMLRKKFGKDITYFGKINYRRFDTLPKIQKLILDENIQSKTELKKKYVQIYRTYLKLKKSLNKDIVFCSPNFDSSYEKLFSEELNKRNITYLSQVCISKNSLLRFDFVIDNIIIEIHGEQHFDLNLSKEIWGDVGRDERKNDLVKRELANKLGYKIYYFTYSKNTLEKFGYFDKVYTDIDELFENIGICNQEIEIENYNDQICKSISNKEEDFRLIKTLDDLNLFLQNNKIKNPSELINDNKLNKLYRKAELYSWVNKLKYYIPENEVGDTKNYRSVDDVQALIDRFKIRNKKEFRKPKFYKVFHKAWKNNWLSQIKYYEEI